VASVKVPRPFQLWVSVSRWIDGDSFAGVLDQAYYTYRGVEAHPVTFRCSLINTPELKGDSHAAGMAAADFARQLAPPGEYKCWAQKPDEYGRPLVDLILPDGRLFSDVMLESGHAVPYVRR
jgi:endonuclease YncB( thermonuclease family)